MTFIAYLEMNKVSFYKITQLLGKDPMHFTGVYKQKLTGKKPISLDEFSEICQALEKYLKKDVKPNMFDLKIVNVLLS